MDLLPGLCVVKQPPRPHAPEVEFAMAVARSAGLEQSQLMETRDAAIRDAARRRARAGLARAMEARDEKALRAAIAFADEAAPPPLAAMSEVRRREL